MDHFEISLRRDGAILSDGEVLFEPAQWLSDPVKLVKALLTAKIGYVPPSLDKAHWEAYGKELLDRLRGKGYVTADELHNEIPDTIGVARA